MPKGTTEAFARVEIDARLKDRGWNLTDGRSVRLVQSMVNIDALNREIFEAPVETAESMPTNPTGQPDTVGNGLETP